MPDERTEAGYEVEIVSPLDESSLGTALEESDLEVMFVPDVPVSDDPISYVTAQGQDVDAVDTLLEEHVRVEQYELVASGPNQRLYRCQWVIRDDGIIATIRSCDGIVQRMTGTSDGWILSVYFPSNKHAAQFHDTCLDRRIDIDVRRVERSHLDERNFPDSGLSEKQLRALELAFARGYFETPKKASLTDVADDIGISEQALSQRLRRALNQLVETFIDDADQ